MQQRKSLIWVLILAIILSVLPTYAADSKPITYVDIAYDFAEADSLEALYELKNTIYLDYIYGAQVGTGYTQENPQLYAVVPVLSEESLTKFQSDYAALKQQLERLEGIDPFDEALFNFMVDYALRGQRENSVAFGGIVAPYVFKTRRGFEGPPSTGEASWKAYMETCETSEAFSADLYNWLTTQVDEEGYLPYFIDLKQYTTVRFLADSLKELNAVLEVFAGQTDAVFVEEAPDNARKSAALKEACEAFLAENQRLQALLEESAAHHEAEGTTRIDKEAYKAQMIYTVLGTDMRPDEVMALGAREVRRIQKLLKEKLNALGYEGDLEAQIKAFKADGVVYTEADSVQKFQEVSEALQKQLPLLFDEADIPKEPVKIQLIDGEVSFYNAYMDGGTFLPARADHPDYLIETLTAHETVPGHHLQKQHHIRLLNEVPDTPYVDFTSYVEGWALYAEKLAREEGLIKTERGEVGSLLFELLRSGRLVADVGINYFGWSDEHAIAYIKEQTFDIHPEAEVDRYNKWPGQALAYKIGEIQIVALREALKAEQGADFDLKAFHKALLSHGPLPLDLLDRAVEDMR